MSEEKKKTYKTDIEKIPDDFIVEDILASELTHLLTRYVYDGNFRRTYARAICLALLNQAKKGDVKAFQAIHAVISSKLGEKHASFAPIINIIKNLDEKKI